MKLRDDWMVRSWGMVMAMLLGGGVVMGAETFDTATVLGKLHRANHMEIEMGRLAMQRGQANGVTSFGHTLVVDHTAADHKVVALAKEEKIDLAATTPGMTDDEVTAKLKTLKGMAFDKTFARAMLEDHTQDVNEAKTARDKTTDTRLKALLVSLIPVLEKHRDIAQKLVDSVGTAPSAAGASLPAK